MSSTAVMKSEQIKGSSSSATVVQFPVMSSGCNQPQNVSTIETSISTSTEKIVTTSVSTSVTATTTQLRNGGIDEIACTLGNHNHKRITDSNCANIPFTSLCQQQVVSDAFNSKNFSKSSIATVLQMTKMTTVTRKQDIVTPRLVNFCFTNSRILTTHPHKIPLNRLPPSNVKKSINVPNILRKRYSSSASNKTALKSTPKASHQSSLLYDSKGNVCHNFMVTSKPTSYGGQQIKSGQDFKMSHSSSHEEKDNATLTDQTDRSTKSTSTVLEKHYSTYPNQEPASSSELRTKEPNYSNTNLQYITKSIEAFDKLTCAVSHENCITSRKQNCGLVSSLSGVNEESKILEVEQIFSGSKLKMKECSDSSTGFSTPVAKASGRLLTRQECSKDDSAAEEVGSKTIVEEQVSTEASLDSRDKSTCFACSKTASSGANGENFNECGQVALSPNTEHTSQRSLPFTVDSSEKKSSSGLIVTKSYREPSTDKSSKSESDDILQNCDKKVLANVTSNLSDSEKIPPAGESHLKMTDALPQIDDKLDKRHCAVTTVDVADLHGNLKEGLYMPVTDIERINSSQSASVYISDDESCVIEKSSFA